MAPHSARRGIVLMGVAGCGKS
ncbi:gluconokinase, partial [Sinorhizobium meliloti]|nr:gluconokinase [Sinorhizobium meliloti]MQW31298.1 gluconokinase [Sinorhizobium meliloti]